MSSGTWGMAGLCACSWARFSVSRRRSPHTPLIGAELLLERNASLALEADRTFEHGLLVDSGVLAIDEQEVKANELACVGLRRNHIRLTAYDDVRVLVLGGIPFSESIVMWWNFVGRSHEEIVQFRQEWQAQITVDGAVVGDGQDVTEGRFGVVIGDHARPIPAPVLPNARLKERR